MRKYITLAVAAVVIVSAEARSATVCNGAESLCGKRYNEVTFAGAHNAMSNADDGWIIPNHFHGIEKQLESGVRALNLDIYQYRNAIYLCHTFCVYGNRKLADALAGVKKFMDANPNEVITINFQDETGGADVAGEFERAGLAEYAHAQRPGEAWPTLGEMVESGRRLVVFGARRASDAPWFLFESDYVWMSPYYAQNMNQLECGALADRPVYMLSHFLTAPYAMAPLAAKANKKSAIVSRALRCWNETGRRPNIIFFDFCSVGDVAGAVEYLNRLNSPADAFTKPSDESGDADNRSYGK